MNVESWAGCRNLLSTITGNLMENYAFTFSIKHQTKSVGPIGGKAMGRKFNDSTPTRLLFQRNCKDFHVIWWLKCCAVLTSYSLLLEVFSFNFPLANYEKTFFLCELRVSSLLRTRSISIYNEKTWWFSVSLSLFRRGGLVERKNDRTMERNKTKKRNWVFEGASLFSFLRTKARASKRACLRGDYNVTSHGDLAIWVFRCVLWWWWENILWA